MRILVGFSGGLDSMMTAALLLEAGHMVEGAVVAMHAHTDTASAVAAAEKLGIPLHILHAEETFTREVIANFVDEYNAARTPNPCIRCNRYVKIGSLAAFTNTHGFDKFATGHYARVVRVGSRYAVARAKDAAKDQSYVLWQLTQEMLAAFDTPLAEYSKETLREMARARGFSVAEQAESQDICFLPNGGYADFVAAHGGKSPPGNFVLTDGTVIGRHKGLIHYTIGQRKHLGIALGQPMFVQALHAATNEVVLAPAGEGKTERFAVRDLVYGALPPQNGGAVPCLVQMRYHAPALPATLLANGDAAEVVLDAPTARLATPGQSAVFYDAAGTVLCGGVIE